MSPRTSPANIVTTPSKARAEADPQFGRDDPAPARFGEEGWSYRLVPVLASDDEHT